MKNVFLLFSPYRIIDDCGGAFAMGAIGGGLFSLVKGWRNAPVVSKIYRFVKLTTYKNVESFI